MVAPVLNGIKTLAGAGPSSAGAFSYPSLGGPNSFVDLISNSLLHSSMQFSRASGGMTEVSPGVLTPSAVNEARYQWFGGKRGLLIEPAATNVLTYSQDFNNAAWARSGATVSDSPVPSPSGGVAQRIAFSAAGSSVYRSQAVLTTGTPWTGTVYLRSDTPGTIVLKGSAGTGLTRVSVTTAWKKLPVTYTPATTSDALTIERTLLSDLASVDVWQGGQEVGVAATSAIATAAAAATRAPDILAIPTAAFGFNSAEGTLVFDIVAPAVSPNYNGLFSLSGGLSSDRVGIHFTPTAGQLTLRAGDANQVNTTFTGTAIKLAFTFGSGIAYVSINGAAPVSVASASLATSFSMLNIGVFDARLGGAINSIAYYPRKFSTVELQAAST